MKTIFIARHAKSSWETVGLSDQERPLLEKGKKRTKKVIDFLHDKKVRPELILCSHAIRAYETARIFAHAFRIPDEALRIHEHIYHCDSEGLFNEFYDLNNDISSVMIVGHNPAITGFANYFLKKKIDWIPTSGVVCIRLKTKKWEELAIAESKHIFTIFPKELE